MASGGNDGADGVQNRPIRSMTSLDEVPPPLLVNREPEVEGSSMVTTVPPRSQQLARLPLASLEITADTTVQPPSQQLWPTVATVPLFTPLQKSVSFQPTTTQFSITQTPPLFTPMVQHQPPFLLTLPVSQMPNAQPPSYISSPSQILISIPPVLPPLTQAMITPSSAFYSTTSTWSEPIATTNTSRRQSVTMQPLVQPTPISLGYSLQFPF